MDHAIVASALSKRYGDRTAVDRLDLQVRTAEVFGLLGPNGAGKTTTMRMLLGLVRPTSGTATVLGRPLRPTRVLGRIGAMIEEPAFHPYLSGPQNLQVLSDLGTAVPADRIAESLNTAGLDPGDRRLVRSYSQGMRQRLALAAALLRRPQLLVLDEPTNGLDPAGIREFRVLMRRLAGDGTTVVLSSHLLAEVEQVCDRVAIMAHGHIAAVDTPAALGRTGRGVLVTVRTPDLDAALAALAPLAPGPLDSGPLYCTLQVGAPDGRSAVVALADAGIYPEAVTTQRSGLEQLYLDLTGDTTASTTDDRRDGRHAHTAS